MKVLLATLHAKYVHASLALPYLASALSGLEGMEVGILELTVNEQRDHLLEKIHAAKADVILFSCYLWNIELTLKIASDLKQLAPETTFVLGGPEVSFGSFEMMETNPAVCCIVRGEGEETVRELLQAIYHRIPLDHIPGICFRDEEDVVANPDRNPIADLDSIPSPFAAGLVDFAKPLVYLETSRGCPFSCAFCMSSLEKGVRSFSSGRIRSDLALVMERGVPTVKLVDRTFNYDAQRANEIWSFILENNRGSRFHFEIAADLLTEENLVLLRAVPPGVFRFEIGVQSADVETLAMVERKSHLERLFANVRRLLDETAVTVHLDLVAGLPGEAMEGFLESLQGLLDLGPHHIQVEPLKVMKGTRMRSIARKEGYAYSDTPPYKVLRTPWLSFEEICRIEGVSRVLDQLYNSGRFRMTLETLRAGTPLSRVISDLARYFQEHDVAGNLSLIPLFEAMWGFAGTRLSGARLDHLRDALCFDFCLTGYPGGNLPSFLTVQPETKVRTVPEGVPQPRQGERVRYYRRVFARDYRKVPWVESATEITFIYRSAPGAGLDVQVR